MGLKEENAEKVVEEQTWIDFWERLKEQRTVKFIVFDDLLTEFVENYPTESGYVSIEELKMALEEIQ